MTSPGQGIPVMPFEIICLIYDLCRTLQGTERLSVLSNWSQVCWQFYAQAVKDIFSSVTICCSPVHNLVDPLRLHRNKECRWLPIIRDSFHILQSISCLKIVNNHPSTEAQQVLDTHPYVRYSGILKFSLEGMLLHLTNLQKVVISSAGDDDGLGLDVALRNMLLYRLSRLPTITDLFFDFPLSEVEILVSTHVKRLTVLIGADRSPPHTYTSICEARHSPLAHLESIIIRNGYSANFPSIESECFSTVKMLSMEYSSMSDYSGLQQLAFKMDASLSILEWLPCPDQNARYSLGFIKKLKLTSMRHIVVGEPVDDQRTIQQFWIDLIGILRDRAHHLRLKTLGLVFYEPSLYAERLKGILAKMDDVIAAHGPRFSTLICVIEAFEISYLDVPSYFEQFQQWMPKANARGLITSRICSQKTIRSSAVMSPPSEGSGCTLLICDEQTRPDEL